MSAEPQTNPAPTKWINKNIRKSYIWTAEKDLNMKVILAVMYTT